MDADQISPVEARVLSALAEKQALTPDSYPMTLNALIAACNQLTSREPVMRLSESEVLAAIDALLARKWIATRTPAGSRASKYEHRLTYVWNIDGARLAVMTILMLRGAQTTAEIRARSGRIYAFSDVEEVEAALQALAVDKYPPMVQKLERQPGAREARWMHLLCGDTPPPPAEASASRHADLAERVSALEAQVETLQTRLAELELLWKE